MERRSSGACLDDSPAAALYQQYAPILLAYLRRRASSWEDAQDVLLEVFLIALERDQIFSIANEQQLPWLLRVAQRKLVDQYRHTTRHPALPLEEVNDTLAADEDLSPEQLVLRHEEQAHLRAMVRCLPVLQQEVLWLRFVHDLRSTEIAAVLGKRENTIRAVLWRALKGLRARYAAGKEGATHEQR